MINKLHLNWFCQFVLASLVLFSANAIADGKIIKWIDEKGVTHYGDKMPAQDVSRKSTELNNQGVTVRQNDPSKRVFNPDDPVAIENARRDHALLASYNSESDIDVARDRNLQLDELAVQALEQRMDGVIKKLAANQKIADGFKKRSKPTPVELIQDLNDNHAEIGKVNKLIAQRKTSMDETRKRYAAEKQRYLELRSNGGMLSGSAPSSPILAK